MLPNRICFFLHFQIKSRVELRRASLWRQCFVSHVSVSSVRIRGVFLSNLCRSRRTLTACVMEGSRTMEECDETCSSKQDGVAEMRPESRCEDQHRWQTVTNDSYQAPLPNLSRTLGRRRELVKNFISIRVFGEAIDAMIAEPPPEPVSPSEYVESFCDSKFTPFMDRIEYDNRKHTKYPLYGGATVQSYYKSQLDNGTLKARSEIANLNEPFRRSSAFTTPPDLAIREPVGGF
ncbi:uncharacterized protein [Neodiprion pinetum]|uniref:uncharacterized protein n=1 Tax=Neodiprion pinetum TaxID=441929 RepID=UPI001EDD8A9F|nr:uncharacterized protein LOC124214548 [Neodiprion pinetum]XP_046472880.1 uncharacterized protein LOC124214548 [Neodiprion pinetum]